jgi:hypothetical protein
VVEGSTLVVSDTGDASFVTFRDIQHGIDAVASFATLSLVDAAIGTSCLIQH